MSRFSLTGSTTTAGDRFAEFGDGGGDNGDDGINSKSTALSSVFEIPQSSIAVPKPVVPPPPIPPSWRRREDSILNGRSAGGGVMLDPESCVRQSATETFDVLRQVLLPSLPMLGSAMRSFDEATKKFGELVSAYVFETKYDGERALAVVRNNNCTNETTDGYENRVEMFTRTLKPLTASGLFANSPVRSVVLKNNAKSIVLDGELVFVDSNTGVPIPICDTGARSAMRCVYMVFDVQQLNGRDTTNYTLLERKKLLSKHVVETECVRIVEHSPVESVDRLRKAFNTTISSGGEGLMVKKLTDPYVSNSRKFWFKLKPVHIRDRRLEFDLYANRAYRDRTGTLAILQCGFFHGTPSKWKPVCKVSSGIRDCDKTRISLLADSATGRFKAPWPIVTVTADKITQRNRSLRHPTFVRFAFEKDTVDSSPFSQ